MPNHGDFRLCVVCGQLAEYSMMTGRWHHYYGFEPDDLHEPVIDESPMVGDDDEVR